MDDFDILNRTSKCNYFIENVSVSFLVSEKSCGVTFYQSRITYLYQDWGDLHS